MKIYFHESLVSELHVEYLFLDTTALILLVNYSEEFYPFVTTLKENGCALLTIPSVVFEFSRTDSLESYNKRIEFLTKNIDTVYPIEKHLEEFQDLIPVLHRIRGRISYPDFLLYCCLYKFQGAYLLTENHSDFITDILDRKQVITIDTNKDQIRNSGFYTFSLEKYSKAAEKVLNKKNTV